jgi:hypothetical protein
MTPFEEERYLAPSLGEAAIIRDFHKLIEPASHQFFKRAAQQMREAPIGREDFSVR